MVLIVAVHCSDLTAPDKWPDNLRGVANKAKMLDITWTVSRPKINPDTFRSKANYKKKKKNEDLYF